MCFKAVHCKIINKGRRQIRVIGFVDDAFNDDDNDDSDDNVSVKLSALSLSPVYGRICRGVDAEKLRPGLARGAQKHIP